MSRYPQFKRVQGKTSKCVDFIIKNICMKNVTLSVLSYTTLGHLLFACFAAQLSKSQGCAVYNQRSFHFKNN